jgi:hypothetical protein
MRLVHMLFPNRDGLPWAAAEYFENLAGNVKLLTEMNFPQLPPPSALDIPPPMAGVEMFLPWGGSEPPPFADFLLDRPVIPTAVSGTAPGEVPGAPDAPPAPEVGIWSPETTTTVVCPEPPPAVMKAEEIEMASSLDPSSLFPTHVAATPAEPGVPACDMPPPAPDLEKDKPGLAELPVCDMPAPADFPVCDMPPPPPVVENGKDGSLDAPVCVMPGLQFLPDF